MRLQSVWLAAVITVVTAWQVRAGDGPIPPAPTAFDIQLKTRIIPADCSVDEELLKDIQASPRPTTHAIVQLRSLPHQVGVVGRGGVRNDDIAALRALGITLLDYLNGSAGLGTAYLASISREVQSEDPPFDALVRCLVPLEATDKIQPGLLPANVPRQSTAFAVLVQFFHDVDEADARAVFARLGVAATLHAPPNLWQTTLSAAQIEALAAEDQTQWLEAGPLPFMPTLNGVRQTSNVNGVQNLDTGTGIFSGLAGTGVQIGIMDTGVDQQHNDFAGRFVRTQDDGGDHGSHVAGIAAGSGARSNQNDDASVANNGTPFQWRGMAPRAGIAAYGGAGGNASIFDDAINNFFIDVSNHSYVLDVQNMYSAAVASVDTIVRGSSPGVPARPAVWAAANNGILSRSFDCDGDGVNESSFPQYPGGCPTAFQVGYFSVLSPCKNCISVASVNQGGGTNPLHSNFSSIGPTMDGRVKPELATVGNGVRSVGANTDPMGNPVTGNGYRTKSGTSMAAPAVTGIVGLVLEQYAATFGVNLDTAPPLPSTSKASLIQTALDLTGTDPSINFDTGAAMQYGIGPDWATGFGLVDAGAAVALVRNRGVVEDEVTLSNVTDTFAVGVGANQIEMRVTLAWDDLAGAVNGNETASKLVNDLDLTVTDPNGVIHRPLILPLVTPRDCDGNALNGIQAGICAGQDAATQNYFGPAAEGIDRRNNVEQVLVRNPAGLPKGIWTAQVSVLNTDGTVRLPLGGTQEYSIAARVDQPVCCADGPYTAECAGPTTSVMLDGSGSFDPNGGALTYTWTGPFAGGTATGASPTVIFTTPAPAVFPVGLTVSDGTLSDTQGSTVVIEDTLPPTLPPNVTAECTSPTGTPVNIGTPLDICDTTVAFTNDAPPLFPLGMTPVSWTATDDTGNTTVGTQVVTVVDTTPPVLTVSAAPDLLWPPNHTLHPVNISITATDACDGTPVVRLVSITSSEPDSGTTPLDKANDIQGAAFGTDDRSFRLRAEHGMGTMRTYTITYDATDDSGNVTTQSVIVRVPKSRPELVSRDGKIGNGASLSVATNTDGRFVAFASDANNLVTGAIGSDTNDRRDVFLRNRTAAQVTQLISVDTAGGPANGASHARGGAPAVSQDGRFVAFYSDATDLVTSDGNGHTDVFVRDRTAGTTERVSVSTTDTPGNGPSTFLSMSEDGRYVAFQSLASNLVVDDMNGFADIFVRDRTGLTTERVCGVEGNGPSTTPAISPDGRFVAFASAATNLVPGDHNVRVDIFVCDRTTGGIERVSVDSAGIEGNGDSILPAISRAGTVVAFKSLASNLVANDRNGLVDVFARDRSAGTTERISVNARGGDSDDVSFPPSVSHDGRFVAFGSLATNLAPPDVNHTSNVFVRDRQSGVTLMADVNDDGAIGNRGALDVVPAVTGDGVQIGFVSLASNLAGPDNEVPDVFIVCNPFLATAPAVPPMPLQRRATPASQLRRRGERSSASPMTLRGLERGR